MKSAQEYRCSVCRGDMMRHTYKLLVENNTRKIARELKQDTSRYVDPKIPRESTKYKSYIFPKSKGGVDMFPVAVR
jgi:hypothetical protein